METKIKIDKNLYKLLNLCTTDRNKARFGLEYVYIYDGIIMATNNKRLITISATNNNPIGFYELIKEKNDYYLEYKPEIIMPYPIESILNIINPDLKNYKEYSKELNISSNILQASEQYYELITELQRPINFEDLQVLQYTGAVNTIYYKLDDSMKPIICHIGNNIKYCFTSIQK